MPRCVRACARLRSQLWFTRVEAHPSAPTRWAVKGLASVGMAAAGWWWATEVAPLAKPAYVALCVLKTACEPMTSAA